MHVIFGMAFYRPFVVPGRECPVIEICDMKTTQRILSISVITVATALLLGCASRTPSTTTAPPEMPEMNHPASDAGNGEGGQGDVAVGEGFDGNRR